MKAQFISATKEYGSMEKYIPAPYLRKTFELDFIPGKANISICGLGFYVLYINGINITKGLLAPYISNPDHICYCDTYDVKEYLSKGKNVIGIILGNGFMNPFCGAVWDFDKAIWRNAPCVALELVASNTETSIIIEADTSFKVCSSPIVFDELRFGEYYDANKEIVDWNKSDFDDCCWQNAIWAPTPRGVLRNGIAEPIRVTKEIMPVQILKQDNDFIYDFGENNAGVCSLKIKAKKGQRIELWYGEQLIDGRFNNRSTLFDRPETQFYKDYGQKDVYIAKGEGVEEYTPTFTYHGFRYVLVKGISEEQASKELLTYKVMSSDLKNIGGFECSDETVNTILEMVKRSDISNFYYLPTDCPHREKNGWTGDASMSASHSILLFDTSNSWREWLNNIRAAQAENGMIPGIIPTYDWGYEWGNGPAWDSVLFNLPYQLYKMRGNTDVILENSDAMMRYLNYIIKRRNADGTISVGLGDWLPVGRNFDDYPVPLEVTDSIMVMDVARKACEMFKAVGFVHQKNFADAIYKDFRNVIRTELVDKNTLSVKGDSQSGQAMALYYGVFEPEEKEKAFAKLMEYIDLKDNNFDCGMLGLHVLFHVLSEFGESELAYKMITKKEYPSYAQWIEQGETTLVEGFAPYGVDTSGGSHNHHVFGDVSRWFMKCIAGLNVIDFQSVEIKPFFIEKLDYASAYYELPKGKVSVEWKRKNDGVILKVNCPDSIRCTIKLPDGYAEENGIIKKVKN